MLRAYSCVYLCNGRAFRVLILSLCTAFCTVKVRSQKHHGCYCQSPTEQKAFKRIWTEHFGQMPFHPVPGLPVILLVSEHQHDSSCNLFLSVTLSSAAFGNYLISWIGVILHQGKHYSVRWGSRTGIIEVKAKLKWLNADVVSIRLDSIRDAAPSLDHPGLCLAKCIYWIIKVENVMLHWHYYSKQYVACPGCTNIYVLIIIKKVCVFFFF